MNVQTKRTLLWIGLLLAALSVLGCDKTTVEKIEKIEPETCESHAECDDGVFCNGQEYCDPSNPLSSSFGCLAGEPCPEVDFIQACNEEARVCFSAGEACQTNSDCDDGRYCNGPEQCDHDSDLADFQGCVRAVDGPCAGDQVCNEVDDLCEDTCPVALDGDGDGVNTPACGGADCDDDDADRYPGNSERCDLDGHDEDCNPETFGTRDEDGDGYYSDACYNIRADGTEFRGSDCDDLDPTVHPDENEVCNGLDDDCDGEIDEGLLADVYPDGDGDGFGQAGAEAQRACWGQGWSYTDTDCDDQNPMIQPGAITCLEGGQGTEYMICSPEGTWLQGSCAVGFLCVQQPADFGVCVP